MTGALQIPSGSGAWAKQLLPIRSGKDIARVHGLARELGSWMAFSRSETECLATAAAQIATLIRRSSKRGAMTVELVVKDGTPGLSLVASFGDDHAGTEVLARIQCDQVESPLQGMEELSRNFDSFDHSVSNGNVFTLTKWARREMSSRAMAS